MQVLTIPNRAEGSHAFSTRLSKLIRASDTHIYIDTSFLMWLTKIGSDSRRELLEWLRENCQGRVHVPIWSAHEYLKHHVAGTISSEFKRKTTEVADIARTSYAYLRPFIDDAIEGWTEAPSSIRTQTRATLNTLGSLMSKIGKWSRSYKDHAAEVIAFINEFAIEQTALYQQLQDIEQVGSARFIGSVPPGYRDQGKGRSTSVESPLSEGSSVGNNKYGDLMFWRETLEHAKDANAVTLLIITNDRKNDWYMGGDGVSNIDVAASQVKERLEARPKSTSDARHGGKDLFRSRALGAT